MKKLYLSFTLMLLPLVVSADLTIDYTYVDGIYYRFDSSTQTAAVTCKSLYYYGEEGPNPDKVTSGNYSGSLVIPPEVTYNGTNYEVTSIWLYAFYGCNNLTSITIPETITSIGFRGVWSGCSGLTSIVVKNGNPKYDSRGNCNAIIESESNTLVKGCKNTIIPNNVTSIGSSAFQECSDLTSVTIPNNASSIGNYAFENCSGLTSIVIPNSVTSIGSSAFQNCSGLTSMTIPDNLTSIESSTFEGCSGLESITIPAGVTSIGYSAFGNCQGLTDVYCWAENAPSVSSSFNGCNLGNITLHVPNYSYQEIQPWLSFGNIVPLADSKFEQCAKPTITFENGEFVFSCATEGAILHYEVSGMNSQSGYGTKFNAFPAFTISVYATKTKLANSETATATFSGIYGDLNNDGVVNVADHVELSKIIIGK